ncbi:S-layer homology domain-containing protein [Sporosarcina sp. HYO08]|uniref:S-layer homology domain-containing protein n=1 Tax=Sporosarcina sp. HYO08 TaxID=1759557 RepID=UPI00079927B6|nr:S-layer homology domain-containing protein [Sporosarcina sp. HYO08]KXH84025.1 hypothetical protein AU377_04530 [Sporosarcina sp. HYO08]
MAHQPKAYKKFVASAATATLVATAIVPVASAAETKSFTDVNKNYEKEVNYLLEKGITQGISDTKFGTDLPIKRGDAAIFIAKALKLDTENAKDQDFTDVNSRVAGAVNAIVEAGIASGKTESTFAPDANITRAEMAKLLVNAYKLQAGETKNTFTDVNNTWDGYVDALLENKVTFGLTDTTFGATQNVTRGQFALFIYRAENPTPPVDEVKAPEVVSVSAINSNKLEVTFNTEVEGAKFEVKKSGVSIAATVEYNAEKTVAVLTKASGDYVAGDYTVTISDVEGLETVTKEVKVEEQKVAEIQIIGDAIKAEGGQSAKVSYKALNQYGDDFTKKASLQVTGSDATNPQLDSTKGLVTLTKDFTANNAPKEVVLTIVDPATGVSASKTVKIADAAAVASFELSELTYPKDKTRVYANTSEAAKIAFTAKDQYGNDIADPSSAVQLISSDTNTAEFSYVKDSDDKYYIKVTTKNITVAKDVTLTAVNARTGAVVTKTFKVELAAEPTSITLGNISEELVAANDTVYMDLEVKDQFGELMEPKDYATSADESSLGITGTAPLAAGQMSIVTDKYDKNYGKLKLEPTAKGTATLVATLGGKTVTKSVEVKDARVLSEVVAPATGSTVIQGATAKLGFKFYDQYGKEIKTVANTEDMTYKITLTKVDGDTDSVVLVTTAEAASEANLNNISVTAANGLTGSYKVKVELLGAANKVLSSAETTVKSVANNVEGLTYTVDAVENLTFDATNGNGAVDGTNPYAKVINVVGTDKDGNKITINPAQILNVEVTGDAQTPYLQVGEVSTANAGTKVDAQEGKWVVAAQKLADKDIPAELNLKVTLNTADGVKVLTAPVTVSKEAPKAQEVQILSKAVSIDEPTKLAEDYKVVDTLTFANRANALTGTEAEGLDADAVFVTVKDQFGVYKNVDAKFIVNTPSLISFGTSAVAPAAADGFYTTDAGAFTLVDGGTVAQFSADKKIKLSVLVGDKTATLDVVIKAEIAPTVTTPAAASIAASGNDDVVFSEELSASSKTAVENAIKAAVKGATASNLTFTWNGATLTVANGNTTTAATFDADVTVDITDLFGNKTTGAIVVDKQ